MCILFLLLLTCIYDISAKYVSFNTYTAIWLVLLFIYRQPLLILNNDMGWDGESWIPSFKFPPLILHYSVNMNILAIDLFPIKNVILVLFIVKYEYIEHNICCVLYIFSSLILIKLFSIVTLLLIPLPKISIVGLVLLLLIILSILIWLTFNQISIDNIINNSNTKPTIEILGNGINSNVTIENSFINIRDENIYSTQQILCSIYSYLTINNTNITFLIGNKSIAKIFDVNGICNINGGNLKLGIQDSPSQPISLFNINNGCLYINNNTSQNSSICIKWYIFSWYIIYTSQ